MKTRNSLLMLTWLMVGCQSNEPAPASPPPVTEPTEAMEATTAFDSTQYTWEDGFVALSWSTLADIDFNYSYSEEIGGEVAFPIFSDKVEALAGRPVQIAGYVIPLEETGDETIIVLSAFPYTQCFFCGGAGPESVIDILPKSPLGRRQLDEHVTFRGRLRLNDDDFQYLNYILEEAELVRQ